MGKANKGKPSKNSQNKEHKKFKIDFSYFASHIFLTILPTVWFSWLYPSCKENLASWGIPVNIGIIFISLFFIIITSYRRATQKEVIIEKLQTKYDDEASKHERTKRTLKGIISSTESKGKILHNYIQEMYNSKNFKNTPCIITQPLIQLNDIIDNICKSICDLTGLSKSGKKVIVSAAIRCNFQNLHDWVWMDNFTPNSSEDISKLSKIPSSAFYKVIQSNGQHYICHNSKKAAYKQQEYYEDVRDVEHINDGIIIAKHYFVKGTNNNNWADIVIFITTKNNIFIENYIDNKSPNSTKDLLNLLVFEEYRSRIEIELMLYTIEKLYKSNHPDPLKNKYN